MCFDLSAIRNIIRSWCGETPAPSLSPEAPSHSPELCSGEMSQSLRVSAGEKEAEREKTATARLEYLTRYTLPRSSPINVPAKPSLRERRELRSTERSELRNETIVSDWKN